MGVCKSTVAIETTIVWILLSRKRALSSEARINVHGSDYPTQAIIQLLLQIGLPVWVLSGDYWV
jgi:hypothetical protein